MTDLSTPIELVLPPRIEIGPGTIARLADWVAQRGCRRVLVVSDPFNARRVGMLGLPTPPAVFGEVRPEPDIPNLALALRLAAELRPDCVIGFGGGSAMDLAKLVSVLLDDDRDVRDIAGVERASARLCALAQVPTTAGTGSEVGIRALVTDPDTRSKLAVQSRAMLADLAVVDADLAMTVPKAVTAATGIDALAHCVEAFTSRKTHPVIDLYALEGIRLAGRFLPRAVRDGADREARAGLALASLYGGICLGPVNTTAGHAVAYPLGTRHHVAHGAANALIFPHTLAYNLPARPDRTRQVVEALGLRADSEAGIRAAATAFCAALGIEMRLGGLGVPHDDLPVMAVEAAAIRRLLDNNPRDIGRDDILALYEAAF